MPKETFHHLPEEKKQRILSVLKKEFQTKPFQKVNIKTVVEELGIARGSFYQYFENLEDSYFTILDLETVDIHRLFMTLFEANRRNLEDTLVQYGDALADTLFQPEQYMLYKNRYLYWNEDLNQKWLQSKAMHLQTFRGSAENEILSTEKIHFIKSILHSLIQRNFQMHWTKEEFKKTYQQHILWLLKGVN